MYRIIKPNESKEIAANKNVKCPYYVVLVSFFRRNKN